MKPPRTHMGVKAAIEVLAGRSLRKQADQYAHDIAPLVDAIRDAKSVRGIEQRMSGALLKRMGTKAVADAIGQAAFQADLIARTEAKPATMKGSKS